MGIASEREYEFLHSSGGNRSVVVAFSGRSYSAMAFRAPLNMNEELSESAVIISCQDGVSEEKTIFDYEQDHLLTLAYGTQNLI